jgi:hypothetical protein
MSETHSHQYLPANFHWRLWLLCERINEIFVAAQRAGMWQPSLREPRGRWALDNKDREPFAGVIWNIDQIMKSDHPPVISTGQRWHAREQDVLDVVELEHLGFQRSAD